MRKPLLALVALAGLAAASCTLSPRDTGRAFIFALPSVPAAATHVAASPDMLTVNLPNVAPELDTARIALVKADGRWDYYAGAKWPDFLPLVVQDNLTQSLAGAHLFRAVTSDQSGTRGEKVLSIAIRDFQAVYDATAKAPVIKVTLSLNLTRRADGETLAAFNASAQVPAEKDRLGSLQPAFATAFRDAQQQAIFKLKQAAQRNAQTSR